MALANAYLMAGPPVPCPPCYCGYQSPADILMLKHNFAWCRDQNLHFVEQVALAPPEVQIDLQQQAAYENQLKEAAAAPLPDEDDDIAE